VNLLPFSPSDFPQSFKFLLASPFYLVIPPKLEPCARLPSVHFLIECSPLCIFPAGSDQSWPLDITRFQRRLFSSFFSLMPALSVARCDVALRSRRKSSLPLPDFFFPERFSRAPSVKFGFGPGRQLGNCCPRFSSNSRARASLEAPRVAEDP